MKIKKNIALSDSGFIFDPSTGNSFTTNPIGLQIVQLLKQAKNQNEIEAHILSNFEIDKSTVEKDLNDFVNMLGKLKLIEGYEKD